MADSLSRKLIAGKIAWIILGITSVVGIKAINHALFADDTLLLGGASLNLARAFFGIMNQFCIVSGALINKSKSVVYGWNVDHSKIGNFFQILGFEGYASWDKVKYLGLPITLGQNNPYLWLEVISKIKAKIVSWGGHWLTIAGKLILI